MPSYPRIEAADYEEAAVSQAGSEPGGQEDAPGMDAVFDNDDAWDFLHRYRNTQNLYSEECKKSHQLQEQVNALEAVLQSTKNSLAAVKLQLVESDFAIVVNCLLHLNLCFMQSALRSQPDSFNVHPICMQMVLKLIVFVDSQVYGSSSTFFAWPSMRLPGW